jgi:hypothetical protein
VNLALLESVAAPLLPVPLLVVPLPLISFSLAFWSFSLFSGLPLLDKAMVSYVQVDCFVDYCYILDIWDFLNRHFLAIFTKLMTDTFSKYVVVYGTIYLFFGFTKLVDSFIFHQTKAHKTGFHRTN